MSEFPTPIPSVPIAFAAEIANIDRRRFNEAVADGSYPCAPETKSRQRRFCDEADVLGLCTFQRLFNCGLHKAEAGRMACDVVEHYRNAARDGDRVLTEVMFPSGLMHRHGIAMHTNLEGVAIPPAQTEQEFIGIQVRVSSLIQAIRQRYYDMKNAPAAEAPAEGDDA